MQSGMSQFKHSVTVTETTVELQEEILRVQSELKKLAQQLVDKTNEIHPSFHGIAVYFDQDGKIQIQSKKNSENNRLSFTF